MTEVDKAAALALLTKFVQTYDEFQQAKNFKEWAEKELAKHLEALKKIHDAYSIFGLNTRENGWDALRDIVGEAAYNGAIARARESNITATEKPGEQSQETKAIAAADTEIEVKDNRPIREIVLDRLLAASNKGAKASEIQAYIETIRGAKLHSKTTGMTLYRLSQDGLARREGRTWFYVQPKAETKNPGADTPGPSNAVH